MEALLITITGIAMFPLVGLQWYAVAASVTKDRQKTFGARLKLADMVLVFVHPAWGVYCLINFVETEQAGPERFGWVLATFIPLVLIHLLPRVIETRRRGAHP